MSTPPDVLFVCQHGAAKSVIAARYFAALARARGLRIDAAAAGIDPYEAIPPNVIAGLRNDGIDDDETPPRAVSPELISNAQIIVSFGCDLATFGKDAGRVVQWTDVPAVSDGYDAARTAILDRLDAILDRAERRSGSASDGPA